MMFDINLKMENIYFHRKSIDIKNPTIFIFKKILTISNNPIKLMTDESYVEKFDLVGLDCFENVNKVLKNKGHGQAVYGWIVWEIIPSILYQLEGHAVYKNISKRLYEVTPHNESDHIIFIEDKNLKYSGRQIKPYWINFSKDTKIDQFIDLQDKYFEKLNDGNLESIHGVITEEMVSESWINEVKDIADKVSILNTYLQNKYLIKNKL